MAAEPPDPSLPAASLPAISPAAWTAILCGAVIATLAMGARQSFGIFIRPISIDLSLGREVVGLALAIQHLLFGLAQPVVGAIADRFGAARVAVVGALMYAGGLALAANTHDPLGLHLTLGVVVGIALSGTTFATVLGAVGRLVPVERRTLAFGVVTAGGSLGQFLVVPGAQALIEALAWRDALLVLAIGILAIVLLACGLARRDGAAAPSAFPAEAAVDSRTAFRLAMGNGSFWLLIGSFFVCGFHIAFFMTHLPAYLTDVGLDAAVGAQALATVGLFNILGSYFFGAWGGRLPKQHLLAAIYGLRAAVMVVFLLVPVTSLSALAFAAAMGFLWLGTIPLTSGLIGEMFGVRHLSMLYGLAFLGHQVGSFLGAWGGGWIFDRTGSYDVIWYLSIGLGLLGAIASMPIRPVLVARPVVA